MNGRFTKILSMLLAVIMLFSISVPAMAVETGEEYLSELRIVYADDYEEACEIISEGAFKDYKVLDANLNEDGDGDGVWLAYKTTTDIEDAITDLTVMQMGGGYKEGNYQQMIKESYEEYVAMGTLYLEAIDYLTEAYDADYFLAKSAIRQLNFYTIKTQENIGLEVPAFEGEKLGDILYDGIDEKELATIFFQGNKYVLENVRSLIAMGVSYNEDGKTYLEKVADEVARYIADDTVYDDEDYDAVAMSILTALTPVRDMLKQLEINEDKLDYTDEDLTDEEIYYSEAKLVAEMLREVSYLDGETLYDFVMNYEDDGDHSDIYPLVAALNEGQYAMTSLYHFYDVIRYNEASCRVEDIEEELLEAEAIYSENPINVYIGVDRSVYTGTFALTTEAYRADAYSQMDLMDEFMGTSERREGIATGALLGGISGLVFTLGCMMRYQEISTYPSQLPGLKAIYDRAITRAAEGVANSSSALPSSFANVGYNNAQFINETFAQYFPGTDLSSMTFAQKVAALKAAPDVDGFSSEIVNDISNSLAKANSKITPVSATAPMGFATGVILIGGGVMFLYSMFTLISTIHNYYNPKYDDVPIAIVDMIETIDGDRYIKYDAVFEAETRGKKDYIPGDLNSYEGQRWNALYYTKSYEAGKPLLADEFEVSNTSNKPRDNYAPVRGFGSVVCYDLNRHNFDPGISIYLSVKRSRNDKSAVTDVPDVIGSVFSAGSAALAGGIGAVVGIGATLATQNILKKKKNEKDSEATA